MERKVDHRSGTESVSYSLLRLVMRYMELDKQMRNFGTDSPIYHSEIHLISEIAKNPDIHIRGLAEQLGITSASVSEMISKLQKKGLVQKSTDKRNLSRLNLSLTDKGRLAHEEHVRYHEELNQMIAAELKDASSDQIAFLHEFCDRMRERIMNFHFDCVGQERV